MSTLKPSYVAFRISWPVIRFMLGWGVIKPASTGMTLWKLYMNCSLCLEMMCIYYLQIHSLHDCYSTTVYLQGLVNDHWTYIHSKVNPQQPYGYELVVG